MDKTTTTSFCAFYCLDLRIARNWHLKPVLYVLTLQERKPLMVCENKTHTL